MPKDTDRPLGSASASASASIPASTAAPRVLIVEDEAIVARDIQRRLVKLGYAVAGIVDNGAEAQRAARETLPEVILMDIVLQGDLDGVDTAARILAQRNVPIIFLTAHSDTATLNRAKVTVPYGYLLKPFDERELHTTIEMALYRHQAEARLRQQAKLLDEARDAMLVQDAAGRIRYWNQGAERLYGWKAEEVLGWPPHEFILRQGAGPWEEIARKMLTRDAWTGEFTHTTKDGRAIDVESRWTQLRDPQGRPTARLVLNTDITERKKMEEQLRQSLASMRDLSTRLQSVREEERTRIAAEIHDVLAQDLTRFKLDLTWILKRLHQPVTDEVREALREKTEAMMAHVHETMNATQQLASELRPPILDQAGLPDAITWQARQFEQWSGIACDVRLPDSCPPFPPDQATALFRILQESLTNVARHAEASRVNVALENGDEGWTLQISDNGRGLPEDGIANRASLGLLGMRERALALGGRFEARGTAGRGTTVTAQFPRHAANSKESSLS